MEHLVLIRADGLPTRSSARETPGEVGPIDIAAPTGNLYRRVAMRLTNFVDCRGGRRVQCFELQASAAGPWCFSPQELHRDALMGDQALVDGPDRFADPPVSEHHPRSPVRLSGRQVAHVVGWAVIQGVRTGCSIEWRAVESQRSPCAKF